MKEYAIYKGDELIVIGTAKECAEYMDVTHDYIRWLARPSRISKLKNPDKSTIAIVLELEDDQ